jgi:hypothetical protein
MDAIASIRNVRVCREARGDKPSASESCSAGTAAGIPFAEYHIGDLGRQAAGRTLIEANTEAASLGVD